MSSVRLRDLESLKDVAFVALIHAAKSLELWLCKGDYESGKELFEELVDYPSLLLLDDLPVKATPTNLKELVREFTLYVKTSALAPQDAK